MLPLRALRSLTLALGGKLDEDEASWLEFTILWNWLQLGAVVAPLLVALPPYVGRSCVSDLESDLGVRWAK
jgi:hypothetical protein